MPEFFTSEEFEVLKRLASHKNNNTEEHKRGYQILKQAYNKLGYWSMKVLNKTFKDGKTKIVRRPTNQANYFDGYLWCQLYPNEDYKNYSKIAFTLGLDANYGFNVKIDTVHLKEDDPTRKYYLQRRGNFLNSPIVKFKSLSEVNGWSELIGFGVDVVNSLKDDYYELIEEVLQFDEQAQYLAPNFFKYLTMNQPLNQILFGPPGTGKTYTTSDLAVQICLTSDEYQAISDNRKEIRRAFKKLMQDGRIEFVTFHQSFTYEDFVEGIKPKTEKGLVQYEIEDGVFKSICQRANPATGNFDEILEAFKKEISEPDGKSPVTIDAQSTVFDVIYRGTNVFYIQPHYSQKEEKPWYPVNIQNIRKVFETSSYDGVYNPTYVREILAFLEKNKGLVKGKEEKKKQKLKYVLIIDEINRGNISQIFGELITLIEEDKRGGRKESLSTILPYSKLPFSIPENVYIIGTMNTADRSVEALDTALRRRFAFQEIVPDPSLLSPAHMIWNLWWKFEKAEFWEDPDYQKAEKSLYNVIGNGGNLDEKKESIWKNWGEVKKPDQVESLQEFQFDGINFQSLLKTINDRIELLIDKDHMIGHSYFFSLIGAEDCEAELLSIFYDKIIPLLEEYFYGDFGKIGLVLGEAFVDSTQGKNIAFAKFSMDDKSVLQDKIVYVIKNYRKKKYDITFREAVRSIYETPAKPQETNGGDQD